MFFNRRTPKEPTHRAPQAAAKPPSGSLFAGSRAVGDADDHVIIDLKSMPEGKYVPLPEPRFETSFLCLESKGTTILVVASEAFSSHHQWELYGRLKNAGVVCSKVLKARREVIQAVHDKHGVDTRQADIPQTETQNAAFDLVDRAVAAGASDIHIETRGSHAQVFFRIYGERLWQEDLTSKTAAAICSTLYTVHADANSKDVTWDPDSVKEAAIEHKTKTDKRVQLRFESTPIHPASEKNFQAVIRVLLMESASKPLESVGYTEVQTQMIDEMLVGAGGMVLLVGPTNSGKSTSMQALMQRLFTVRGDTIKAVTVEDPVEYVIAGACQMGVPKNRKNLESATGNIFNTFLKATLRLDPDVVLVGEIRDASSASNTKDLVLAGRKLLSTLHVYEGLAVFERLKELGVPPSVLYMEGFISGVIYQRLVPLLCDKCALSLDEAIEQGRVRPALVDRLMRVPLGEGHAVRVRNPGGCAHCKHMGIVGRTPCAELLVPDATMLSYLREGNERAARSYWHSRERQNVDGLGVTAVAHAIYKMRQGLVDPNDIESQIGTLQVTYNGAPTVSAPAPAASQAGGYGFGGGRFDGPGLNGAHGGARLPH